MYHAHKISIVIPTYNAKSTIKKVVDTLPEFIDTIIVVDDKCPQSSSSIVKGIKKVSVICNMENLGVGGAVIQGYKKALDLNSDIVVKMDSDGQMKPEHIISLITPIIDNMADYTKGNRFNDFNALKQMPMVRLFGNSALSFLVKFSSGYWDIMDPTNGFTAISSKAIHGMNIDNLDNRYFFETDMLINLNIENCVVKDIPMPAVYEDEESNMSINNILTTFPQKIIKGFSKRIFLKYYIYNFNMASIYILLGLPMFLFGVFFGFYIWGVSIINNIENSSGTIMLAVLPIILGVQFLLQAISIDIANTPKGK